jgi:predicted permease
VLIMIGIGMLLAHRGWFTSQTDDLLAKLVTHVAMPSMTVNQLLLRYRRDELLAVLPSLGAALASILLLYGTAVLFSTVLRIPRRHRGIFRAMFTFGNTIFIGLPINIALFGEGALPAALMYYLANTALFWIIGAPAIRGDGGAPRAGFSWNALRPLLTPPLLAFLLSVALVLSNASLPDPVMQAAGYVGGMVTPLSLLFVGGLLYRMLRRGLRWQRGYGAFVFSRFVLSPALTLAMIYALGGMSPLWRGVYLVQASMPSQTSCAIVAHSYHADAEYATGGITVTTLLSMISIPFFAAMTTVLP